jgi:hypothetical protein
MTTTTTTTKPAQIAAALRNAASLLSSAKGKTIMVEPGSATIKCTGEREALLPKVAGINADDACVILALCGLSLPLMAANANSDDHMATAQELTATIGHLTQCRHALTTMSAQYDSAVADRDRLRLALAESENDRRALEVTSARAQTQTPAPISDNRAQTFARLDAAKGSHASLLDAIVAATAAQPVAVVVAEQVAEPIAPKDAGAVVIRFAPGKQSPTLRKSGKSLDDLYSAGFRFKFDKNPTAEGSKAGAWFAPRTPAAESLSNAIQPFLA